MFIPMALALLPHLITLAENQFSADKSGVAKKAFVMGSIEKVYDYLYEQGEVPKWVKKEFVMKIMSVLVDEFLPVVLGKIDAISKGENHHV